MYIDTKQSIEKQGLAKLNPTTHTYRGYTIKKNGKGSKYTIKQGRKVIYSVGFVLLSQATKYIDEGIQMANLHIGTDGGIMI